MLFQKIRKESYMESGFQPLESRIEVARIQSAQFVTEAPVIAGLFWERQAKYGSCWSIYSYLAVTQSCVL